MKRWQVLLGIAVVAVLGVHFLLGPGGIKGALFRQAMPIGYFEPSNTLPAKLERVNNRTYSFRFGFNRGLVVDTQEGLAVFDTFNPKYAAALKAKLDETFPGKPVRWVFYSHHHLDHIGGTAVLEPQEVIGHADVNASLDDWPRAKDLVRVTSPIDGDALMTLGSVRVELLFMPRSHSTTLYGVYLPDEDVVFAPDMMFVKSMPPFGFPDWYYPGYIRALDRLIALDAGHYVPSHFDNGSRDDLIAYRNMMVDFRDTVAAGLERHGYEAASGANLRAVFDEAYPILRSRYGDWHGFDAMFVPHFGGQAAGTYLGY